MKIILFGLRRSGTTLAFNIFRRCHDLRCYYEPMHPNLVEANGASCIENDHKGAYSEFKLLEGELKRRHAGFGAPRHDVLEELVANNLNRGHLDYLDYLFGSANNVLLQPVRLNYQLYQLKERYPDARFIWVLRRPEGFINSVLAYRDSLLTYKDAGIPGNTAISSFRKNPFFRLMRGWHAFDNPWSQIAAANHIVASRPSFRGMASLPTWIKLAALWYDHYLFVSTFIKANLGSCHVLSYDKACGSAAYIEEVMNAIGLQHPKNAFDGLIDADVMRKHSQSRIDITEGERMVQERMAASGIELDLSFRKLLD